MSYTAAKSGSDKSYRIADAGYNMRLGSVSSIEAFLCQSSSTEGGGATGEVDGDTVQGAKVDNDAIATYG
jgi:hypothetical protein